MDENNWITRQERREIRMKKKRERMLKHGAGLSKIYRDAVEKRTRSKKS